VWLPIICGAEDCISLFLPGVGMYVMLVISLGRYANTMRLRCLSRVRDAIDHTFGVVKQYST
jgi:hypothetical protein